MGERDQGKRCPGGYLIRGSRLCGRSGNNCQARCAFDYLARDRRSPPHPDPEASRP